jgi:hypothetical protein
MATGRIRQFAPWLLLGLVSTGCSQPGVFTSRQTMVGSLKASVSQLEFENEKLKKDLGELKAENSRLDSQLAQEQAANGEITARLDDAKDLIRREGGNPQALGVGSSSRRTDPDDEIPPPVVTPKSRSTRRGRTPPAAQIPSPVDPTPFGTSNDGLGSRNTPRSARDFGTEDGDLADNWLPVARGAGSTVR